MLSSPSGNNCYSLSVQYFVAGWQETIEMSLIRNSTGLKSLGGYSGFEIPWFIGTAVLVQIKLALPCQRNRMLLVVNILLLKFRLPFWFEILFVSARRSEMKKVFPFTLLFLPHLHFSLSSSP